jgi:hypothetical protein
MRSDHLCNKCRIARAQSPWSLHTIIHLRRGIAFSKNDLQLYTFNALTRKLYSVPGCRFFFLTIDVVSLSLRVNQASGESWSLVRRYCTSYAVTPIRFDHETVSAVSDASKAFKIHSAMALLFSRSKRCVFEPHGSVYRTDHGAIEVAAWALNAAPSHMNGASRYGPNQQSSTLRLILFLAHALCIIYLYPTTNFGKWGAKTSKGLVTKVMGHRRRTE